MRKRSVVPQPSVTEILRTVSSYADGSPIPDLTYATHQNVKQIVSTVKTVVPTWVDVNTGEVLTPDGTMVSEFFKYVPKGLVDSWVKHVTQLFEIVSTEDCSWSPDQLFIIKNEFDILSSSRRSLMALHRVNFLLKMADTINYDNDYTAKSKKERKLKQQRLTRELEAVKYSDVAFLLGFESMTEEDSYVWVAVQPAPLTVTQYRNLPGRVNL